MRINNNITAMNTHRQLGQAQTSGAKSMEKLSSGYRINRAGDDAAGLAISEKMRGQVRGLNQASRNAQDGISLIQTAEGALNETHAILQRMRELAVQSSTDTNTDADRAEIQKEVDQLSKEITRISTDTEFNTKKLLNGDYSEGKFHIGANANQSTELTIGNMASSELSVDGTSYELAVDNLVVTGRDGNKSVALQSGASGTATTTASTTSGGATTVTLSTDSSGTVTATLAEVKAALEAEGFTVEYATGQSGGAEAAADSGGALSTGTVISGLGINVSTQTDADAAITTINDAISTVSSERSKLGAMQNRLEHTIKNLDTSAENLQASESRIRDVDMAKEIMEQTKNDILQQASTSMLAQANQQPETVLQLLR